MLQSDAHIADLLQGRGVVHDDLDLNHALGAKMIGDYLIDRCVLALALCDLSDFSEKIVACLNADELIGLLDTGHAPRSHDVQADDYTADWVEPPRPRLHARERCKQQGSSVREDVVEIVQGE